MAKYRPNLEQRETIKMIKDAFKEINRTGKTQCRVCGFVFTGRSFGEILEKLGRHGERRHPEIVGPALTWLSEVE